MPSIIIDIDVLNPKEIVAKKKGKFVTFFASVFMNKDTLKKKVEDQVTAEVAKALEETLGQKLKEEGVEAKINIIIKNNTFSDKV